MQDDLSAAGQALADATRRAILERLCESPQFVSELAARFPVSRSAVSQHLRVLERHGLVRERRDGRRRIYSVDAGALSSLGRYFTALGERADSPGPAASATTDPVTLPTPGEAQDRVDRMLAGWSAPWGRDAGAIALVTRLLLIGRIMEKLLSRACAEHGVTKVDVIILGTLSRLPSPHQSAPGKLSRIAVLSPPGITKRLDHLERRKLIVRRAGAKDRRTQIIRLTQRGRRVYEAISRANLSGNLAAVFALSPRDRETLNAGLRLLLRDLEARV